MLEYPKIVVIGAKGVGKTSLIRALTFNDSIALKPTKTISSFLVQKSCYLFYEFINTPPFCFEKEIIEELNSFKAPSHKRHELLKNFVLQYKHEPLLQNDITILQSILESDAIIFVSNAKEPILSIHPLLQLMLYFKQPILPVINLTKNAKYLNDYKIHFKLFFNNFIAFDPLNGSIKNILYFYKNLTITLNNWNQNFIHFSKAFKREYNNRLNESAKVLASFIFSLLEFQMSANSNIYYLKNSYFKEIVEEEQKMHHILCSIWGHEKIVPQIKPLFLNAPIPIQEQIIQEKKQNSLLQRSKSWLSTFSFAFEPFIEERVLKFANKDLTINFNGKNQSNTQISQQYYFIGPIKDEEFYLLIIQRALNLIKNLTKLSYAREGKVVIKEEFTLPPLLLERLKSYLSTLLEKKESKESFERFLYSLLRLR